MGTQWPVYAALVLGANLIGAIAIMTFVLYFLPMPEIKDFAAELPSLMGVAAVYLIFAVVIGIAVTLLLFRPVLDWQRNPDEHDPNMVRNLVLRIPVYQSVVAAAVWLIGIILAVVISGQESGRLGLVVGVSATLAGLVVIILTYLQAERLVRPVAAQAVARRFEDSTLEPPIKYRLISTWLMTSGVPVDLPKTAAAPLNQETEPLTVSVNPEGRIFLQDTEVQMENLVPQLQAIMQNQPPGAPERRIFVRGDRTNSYGRIMEVMGAIVSSGFTRVALLAEQPSGAAPAGRGAVSGQAPGQGAARAPAR